MAFAYRMGQHDTRSRGPIAAPPGRRLREPILCFFPRDDIHAVRFVSGNRLWLLIALALLILAGRVCLVPGSNTGKVLPERRHKTLAVVDTAVMPCAVTANFCRQRAIGAGRGPEAAKVAVRAPSRRRQLIFLRTASIGVLPMAPNRNSKDRRGRPRRRQRRSAGGRDLRRPKRGQNEFVDYLYENGAVTPQPCLSAFYAPGAGGDFRHLHR